MKSETKIQAGQDIKINSVTTDPQTIENEIVNFIGDNNDIVDMQEIEDLQNQWSDKVKQKHFNKICMSLSENSFDQLPFSQNIKLIYANKDSVELLNNHPFEWLNQKEIIKLFNILRFYNSDIKMPHEVSKDGIRFTILEWLHIYNLLTKYLNEDSIPNKLQDNAKILKKRFDDRFYNVVDLNVDHTFLMKFCVNQAETAKKWKILRVAMWLLILISFSITILDHISPLSIAVQLAGLGMFLMAFGILYYQKYRHPNQYMAKGKREMMCDKLIRESF